MDMPTAIRRNKANDAVNALVLAAVGMTLGLLFGVALLLERISPAFAAFVAWLTPQGGAILLLFGSIGLVFAVLARFGRGLQFLYHGRKGFSRRP